MWCPHARLDTENELPRAKPIPLEQYFQRPESSRRRAMGAKGENPKKDLAKKKSQKKIFLKKKILRNMNSGLKCRKMVLELFFLLQYSNFGFPIGAKGEGAGICIVLFTLQRPLAAAEQID